MVPVSWFLVEEPRLEGNKPSKKAKTPSSASSASPSKEDPAALQVEDESQPWTMRAYCATSWELLKSDTEEGGE
jgi:hypothetical protein